MRNGGVRGGLEQILPTANLPQNMTKIAELLRKHLSDSPRGEQSRMVKAMGINKSTMTRWLDGDQVPGGRNSETIVDYIRKVRREKKAAEKAKELETSNEKA